MSIHSLLSIPDIDDKYDELKLLIEADHSVLQSTNKYGQLPIHVALVNPHTTLRIIQLLLDSWPQSVSEVGGGGRLPIRHLCENEELAEAVSVDILTLLLQVYPESVQRENEWDGLPLHTAVKMGKSPKFLKILVNSYPESVQIQNADGWLPIHWACYSDYSRVDTVKFLLDIYPESIHADSGGGWLPIHQASSSNGTQKVDVIEHLLSKDPTCASKVTENGEYPLHLACLSEPNLTVVQLLFDVFPEAIFKRDINGKTPLECAREFRADTDHYVYEEDAADALAYLNSQKAQVINFLQAQQFYANSSPESLEVQDENGRTRLHQALKNKAPLGTIKLLVKKSAVAVRMHDTNMVHIACEFSSVKVVQYLMEVFDERMRNYL